MNEIYIKNSPSLPPKKTFSVHVFPIKCKIALNSTPFPPHGGGRVKVVLVRGLLE